MDILYTRMQPMHMYPRLDLMELHLYLEGTLGEALVGKLLGIDLEEGMPLGEMLALLLGLEL